MTVKYQVFVSSTYEDLKDERDQVIRAILEMGHFPVGMEMFSAADERQWRTIQREIDQSDYYIVIVAHKYGSMDGQTSYTEKEYDYALGKEIPILGFIIDDHAEWPEDKRDRFRVRVKALRLFKEKVKQKPVSSWKNADDLGKKVAIALGKQMQTMPRLGWTRTFAPDIVKHSKHNLQDAQSVTQTSTGIYQFSAQHPEIMCDVRGVFSASRFPDYMEIDDRTVEGVGLEVAISIVLSNAGAVSTTIKEVYVRIMDGRKELTKLYPNHRETIEGIEIEPRKIHGPVQVTFRGTAWDLGELPEDVHGQLIVVPVAQGAIRKPFKLFW